MSEDKLSREEINQTIQSGADSGSSLLKGRYQLEACAGRGGMGEVWKAYDIIGGHNVALKFVPRDVTRFESEMRRVKQTYQTVHDLNHQNICPIYALEEDTARGYFLVMRWLEGDTLDAFVEKFGAQGKLPPEQILQILTPVSAVLDYAHKQGVVHRDIKPSNIFIDHDNGQIKHVWLIDFGLASEIRESMSRVSQNQFNTSGTRPYMPPEQWRGRKQDEKTDQYSLAVVAYELFAGCLPFSAPDIEILRVAILNDEPERIASVSDSINAVLMKGMAKERADRFDTCEEFTTALSGKGAPVKPSAPHNTPVVSVPPVKVEKIVEDTITWESHVTRMKPVAKRFVDTVAEYNAILIDRLPDSQKAKECGARIHALAGTLYEYCRAFRDQRTAELVVMTEEGYRDITKHVIKARNDIECLEKTMACFASGVRTEDLIGNVGIAMYFYCSAGESKKILINGVDFVFKYCPAGTFMMGSPEDIYEERIVERPGILWNTTKKIRTLVQNSEADRSSNETQHEVTLTQGFWMLETQVTQKQWQAIMGDNPSRFKGDNLPVESVSWNDCQKFCKKLNSLSGLKTGLPTEAQWEYACRAGTTGAYAGSLDSMAWYGLYSTPKGTSQERTTHPVGMKQPNAWGLSDMHGNVWEWCSDWYGDYSRGSVTDPAGAGSGTDRVFRGGSWKWDAKYCRSAFRGYSTPDVRYNNLGFRPVLDPGAGN